VLTLRALVELIESYNQLSRKLRLNDKTTVIEFRDTLNSIPLADIEAGLKAYTKMGRVIDNMGNIEMAFTKV
jgi:hypothetical protein